ncbi:MAG: hypothetical protein C4341_03480 [Armatimonadota bacterium]
MRTITTAIALVVATALTAVAQVNPALFAGLQWKEIEVVQGSPFRPTDQAIAVFEELSRLLDAELAIA